MAKEWGTLTVPTPASLPGTGTVGQVVCVNGVFYGWNGTAWASLAAGGGAGSVTSNIESGGVYPTRPTANVVAWFGPDDPGTAAADNDLWVVTNQTYVYPVSHQVEIDMGATPIVSNSFVVNDTSVTTSSVITGSIAYVAPTGKDLDELEMDAIDLKFAPGSSQLTIYVAGLEGYLHDKFKINYVVGN